jgi:hypothetical protein
MEDVHRAVRQAGMTVENPTRGSHFKVVSFRLKMHLTIPFNRPIKPPYIRRLCQLIDAHNKAAHEEI